MVPSMEVFILCGVWFGWELARGAMEKHWSLLCGGMCMSKGLLWKHCSDHLLCHMSFLGLFLYLDTSHIFSHECVVQFTRHIISQSWWYGLIKIILLGGIFLWTWLCPVSPGQRLRTRTGKLKPHVHNLLFHIPSVHMGITHVALRLHPSKRSFSTCSSLGWGKLPRVQSLFPSDFSAHWQCAVYPWSWPLLQPSASLNSCRISLWPLFLQSPLQFL